MQPVWLMPFNAQLLTATKQQMLRAVSEFVYVGDVAPGPADTRTRRVHATHTLTLKPLYVLRIGPSVALRNGFFKQ